MLNPTRILITGASGLVGKNLTKILLQYGYDVIHLSRSNPQNNPKIFTWDIGANEIQPGAFEGVDVIIHLAGANVAEGRWTQKRKKELLESRTESSALLRRNLENINHQVKHFISASAVGYYGFRDNDKIFREEDPPGNDFLASLTSQWEAEVDQIRVPGMRVVKLRTGVVLSRDGGALAPIAATVRKWIGAPLGYGSQFISWIHLTDLCRMFLFVLQNQSVSGPVNAVAPNPVTNKQLTEVVAQVLNKPLMLPNVPAIGLKIAFGEMAQIVLNGSRVSASKLIDAGFEYEFPDINSAVKDLLS
ncbi:MAG TPA: TIGR01777 family oxidoreductase [Chryseosolibacter sp.]|nr:TIGR01777 family oxidoreductase [Chryseosolibacter sp.]